MEVVQAWIEDFLKTHPTLSGDEAVKLSEAYGRILAKDVIAPISIPHFQRGMMDGFAVRAEDLQGATEEKPVLLERLGLSRPGQGTSLQVQPGTAIQIFTGAPLPDGADTVIPIEHCKPHNDKQTYWEMGVELPAGKHVAEPGEDLMEGSKILAAGRRIRPADVGLLSMLGMKRVPVRQKPKVSLLITGNELLPPGSQPEGFRFADSNGPMLQSLVQRDGAYPLEIKNVIDHPEEVKETLRQTEADLILVSGGTSAGGEDYLPQILKEDGELIFHGIATKPGGPAGIGFWEGKLVFLLPGNPVACYWIYELFVSQIPQRWGGKATKIAYSKSMRRLNQSILSKEGRTDFVRGTLVNGGITPLQIQGGSRLTSIVSADGFLIIPSEVDQLNAGDTTEFYHFENDLL
ncbi:Molybdopterin molybdenumtransferase [Planctomycetales bacterium 10988]|nr:Molybdopterin molybdenumtransferase [Planctomycetales bacterium 10988]